MSNCRQISIISKQIAFGQDVFFVDGLSVCEETYKAVRDLEKELADLKDRNHSMHDKACTIVMGLRDPALTSAERQCLNLALSMIDDYKERSIDEIRESNFLIRKLQKELAELKGES
jgi:hypothetical protein